MTRMRWLMRSRASIGIAIVSTVAKAHTAARIVTISVGLAKLLTTSMTNRTHLKTPAQSLELEVDHLTHDEHAREHPGQAEDQHEVAGARIEQRHDVVGRRAIDHEHDGGRQRKEAKGASL